MLCGIESAPICDKFRKKSRNFAVSGLQNVALDLGPNMESAKKESYMSDFDRFLTNCAGSVSLEDTRIAAPMVMLPPKDM